MIASFYILGDRDFSLSSVRWDEAFTGIYRRFRVLGFDSGKRCFLGRLLRLCFREKEASMASFFAGLWVRGVEALCLARRFLIVTPFLKGVTLALFLIHLFFVWSPLKKSRIDRVIIFDGVDDKQDEMWDWLAAWRLRKRSRHGSTEAFRQRSSAVGGGGEIGYGFRCWVACFLRQWRLEKGSGDTCASQLRSQHVRRA